mgnify:CR=1 FL=1|tara:strand:- start:17959 stop:18690 length:732 start_codon:yes stop_codon:yes gene_type:complete
MKRPVIIAHEYIRNRILSGEFATGDTLSTKHLADDIGVSRTPIRDALRQLETEGLVEIYPRQEARVKQASYEELRDIWELRIALETHAASLAALRHTQEDIERMERLLDEMRNLVEKFQDDPDRETRLRVHRLLGQADMRFHLSIFDASRNRLIKDEIHRFRLIHDVVLPFSKNPSRISDTKSFAENLIVWESHRTILDAIKAKDIEATYIAMKEHLTPPKKQQLQDLRDEMENRSIKLAELV